MTEQDNPYRQLQERLTVLTREMPCPACGERKLQLRGNSQLVCSNRDGHQNHEPRTVTAGEIAQFLRIHQISASR